MPAFFRRSRLWRAALLWLLACVLPLQCGAAAVRAAAGPAHVHPMPKATPLLLLDDVRRQPAPRAVFEAAVALTPAALLHGHAHAQRHHHLQGDAGTVVAGEAALEQADGLDDGAAAGAAFAALLPLPASTPAWAAGTAAHRRPAWQAWSASWQASTPLERPPRPRLG